MVGENLTLKDGVLLFESIKYLVPVVESKDKLEGELERVGTLPQQMKKDAKASKISTWCARQDSNLRPLGSKPSTLIR
jgi:hypothetical protein